MPEEKTPFNSLIAKFERIDKIKKEIHYHRQNKNYDFWKDCLTSYMLELDEKMTKTEREESKKFEGNLGMIILESGSSHIQVLYSQLTRYQLFLLRVESRLGWSVPENKEFLIGD